MAPEIVSGKKYDPEATDIWSLGVVLFGMVNGYMPFDGATDAELFQNIRKGEFEMADDLEISEDCEDLMRRMMEPDTKYRITLPEIREHILMRGPKKDVAICIEEL